jgi:Mrp family chromosome partitioning ATPase
MRFMFRAGSCKEKDEENNCAIGRMTRIMHKIIIASGKGGVGKNTVSVNLAWALKNMGYLLILKFANQAKEERPLRKETHQRDEASGR